MKYLRWLTAGESHGPGLLGILEGLPAGLKVDADDIAAQLYRRQQGHGRGKRMAIEKDRAEIYSGIRYGETLGSPIGLILPNKDWPNWTSQMSIAEPDQRTDPITLPRPGHADLAGVRKYGATDIRNVLERASARETAMRVALGTLARLFLRGTGVTVGSRVTKIHNVTDDSTLPDDLAPEELSAEVDLSPVRCYSAEAAEDMIRVIDLVHAAGDSVGGVFEVIAKGVPYGLGSYIQWDLKLKARLAEAVMSINAIEGVQMGLGFEAAGRTGSEFHDEIVPVENSDRLARTSNNVGGVEAGLSNAQPIVVRAVMKPLPTLIKPLRSVDLATGKPGMAHKERTDTCAVPAASIVAESMVCLVLADAMLEKFGGDSMEQVAAHMQATAQY